MCFGKKTLCPAVLPVAGALLLAAAILKWLQLVWQPLPENGLLTSRWFLAAVIEVELLFGVWFLSGLTPRLARPVAALLFTALAGISLAKALAGHLSCGCFGALMISPWVTLALDLAIVTGLLAGVPAPERQTSGRGKLLATATAALVILTFPARVVAYVDAPAVLAADGVIVGDGGFVVLQPEWWPGKRLPLLRFIDIGEQLAEGDWLVVFYHRDCPKCEDTLAEYERQAVTTEANGQACNIAFIEVPSASARWGRPQTLRSLSSVGRLSEDRTWLVRTPVTLRLRDGAVVSVE